MDTSPHIVVRASGFRGDLTGYRTEAHGFRREFPETGDPLLTLPGIPELPPPILATVERGIGPKRVKIGAQVVYSLHLKDAFQQTAALLYAASALGIVYAGDLITLFVSWELLAVTSAAFIWV